MTNPLHHILEEAKKLGTQVQDAERAYCQTFNEYLSATTSKIAPRKRYPRDAAQFHAVVMEAKKREAELMAPIVESFETFVSHLKVVDARLAEEVLAGTCKVPPAVLQKVGEHIEQLSITPPKQQVEENQQFVDTPDGIKITMAFPISERIMILNELLNRVKKHT